MGWDSKVQRLLGHATSGPFFGQPFTHRPAAGDDQPFAGVWSDAYMTADPDTGVQVMSSDPNVGVRLSDFIVAPVKNAIIIKNATGVQYRIRAVEPDGEGGATLVLEKV